MQHKPFGHYFIQARLGAGRMTIVYKAFNQRTGQGVALKILHSALAAQPGVAQNFLEAAAAYQELQHPHILVVSESGMIDGQPFLAVEVAEGGTLADRFRNPPPIPIAQSVRWISQIAAALDHAHAQGVLHGDLTMNNVLFAPQLKVSDFSLIEAMAGVSEDILMGTPESMAPEAVRGVDYLSEYSDQYSLAAIAYALATGRYPLHDHLGKLIDKKEYGKPAPPSDINPALPPALDRVLLKGLATDPADRYASAGEFAADFQIAVEDHASHKGRKRSDRRKRPRRISPAMIVMAGLLIIAVFVGVLVLSQAGDDLPDQEPVIIVNPTRTTIPSITPSPPIAPTRTLDVTLTPAATRTPIPTYTPTITLTPIPVDVRVISEARAIIRSGPGITFGQLSRLNPGTVVRVIAYTEQADGWFLIELSEGESGWISASVVAIEGDTTLEDVPTPATIPANN